MRQPIPLPVFQGLTETERDTSRPIMLVGFQHQGNLGLGYLTSVLRQYGYSVHVVDIEQTPEEILQSALQLKPLLIGFSLIFQFFIERYAELLRGLRANGVNCHFTMGGHFPSLSYQQTLDLVPELDSVVRFEGEMTLVELADAVSCARDWRGIQGIAYRNGREVTATPARPLVEDLDQLPYPERNYEPEAVLGRSIMPILASRGCARTCSFCSIHTFYRAAPGRIVRTRKPAEVVREMRMLHEERGITIFLFRAVEILKSIGLMFEYGFMLLDPSSTFESVRENLGFLRTILADGCLPVTFCRMLPYDGTPIKDELVRTGRLRGDVCNPDYDFLDPRLHEFYEGLRTVVNVLGWIHGFQGLTTQLNWAWHEVAVMQHLFPALPGMKKYEKALRGITSESNGLLLQIVEDLSYVFSDGRENRWDPDEVQKERERFLADLLAMRDTFVYRHEVILLDALERDAAPNVSQHLERVA